MDAILDDMLIFANVLMLFVIFCVVVIAFLCMRFVTQGSKTFIFEELNKPSKDYLLAIGRNKGDVLEYVIDKLIFLFGGEQKKLTPIFTKIQ
jgi:hypothetical protein